MKLIGNINRRKLYLPDNMNLGLGYEMRGKIIREICNEKKFLVGYMTEEWYDEGNDESKLTLLWSIDEEQPLVYSVNDYALRIKSFIAPCYKNIKKIKELIESIYINTPELQ